MTFWFSLCEQLVLNVLVFKCLASKRRKVGNEQEKRKSTGAGPLNPLEVPSARGGCNNSRRDCSTGSLPLCLYLHNHNRQSQLWFPVCGDEGPYCPTWLPQAVCKLIQQCKNGGLTLSWMVSLLLCTELKLVKMNHNLLSKPSPGRGKSWNTLQRFKKVISGIFCQYNCYLGRGNRFLALSIPPSSLMSKAYILKIQLIFLPICTSGKKGAVILTTIFGSQYIVTIFLCITHLSLMVCLSIWVFFYLHILLFMYNIMDTLEPFKQGKK